MNDSSELDLLAWPASRIAEAVRYLAGSESGADNLQTESLVLSPNELESSRRVGPWLESVAASMEMEAVAVEATYSSVGDFLESCAPAILRLPGSADARFLVLIASGKRKVTLLGLDGSTRRVSTESVAFRMRSVVEQDTAVAEPIEQILDQVELRGSRRAVARGVLLQELHGDRRLQDGWLIRPIAAAPLSALARDAGLMPLLGSVAVLHVLQYSFWILAWWLLGWMSVRGRFEPALFYAWMLLLLAMIPFRILSESVGGTLAIRAGILLKRRLLAGAFRLETQEVRQWGIGQLLGRVIESEAVESLSVTGGFLALTSIVELTLTIFVLAAGAGGWLHVLSLLVMVGIAAMLAMQFFHRQLHWTQQRLELTNDLVERMIGHRTRLAQQPQEQWNLGEDEALERYLAASRQADGRAAALVAIVPRCWLIVGLLGLAPALISDTESTVSLAVGLGGVVMAYQALGNLIAGGLQISIATIAWRRIKILIDAATRREPIGRPQASSITPSERQPLITTKELVFRHRGRSQPVLQGVDLSIRSGERLLLEGSSGGGKSTLAALLAGSRVPESGLLLLHGLDRETLGAANWRRRVVVSPQFHENHVLIGPLCFNLLMGRRWPPTKEDLQEAERTCRELGLGPLLDRMPGGMFQMVGETGWQMSHGEKSRLFIARALLQRADLTILDETFAALDPQNLEVSLSYVLENAPTVLVIAHP